ncbi:unnamed protein product [Ambrosiozyma monospora]|uniref:Unnamed protein product n=1 Tax=Ambrosiozyma monospora TaxID=43982 RepID=A0ACB5T1C1_AMBMO|nr:unnamed protein product [Ambrosiozyma monospora]
MSKFKFGVFQYKILALLASTFQNVFLFDCDAMPVMNPDYLFEWGVYKSYGMLLWPDIIKRTTSPDTLYYNLDGPFGYYPLITQSGPGEGDKDTFAMAAHFYNRPYYQPYHPPRHGGYDNAYLQSEPISEFAKLKKVVDDKGYSREEKDASCEFSKHRIVWLEGNTWDKKLKGYSYGKLLDGAESQN